LRQGGCTGGGYLPGVRILREAGISNISFDLIAGLPHQTKESGGNR